MKYNKKYSTTKYIAKKESGIRNTYLWKYLSNIKEMYRIINIQTDNDIENIIDELEYIYTNLYKKYEILSNKHYISLKRKILEDRLSILNEVISSIRVIEANFRNDEERIEDNEESDYDEFYDNLIEDTETDVLESLLCIK